jgi:hypothetical protein
MIPVPVEAERSIKSAVENQHDSIRFFIYRPEKFGRFFEALVTVHRDSTVNDNRPFTLDRVCKISLKRSVFQEA